MANNSQLDALDALTRAEETGRPVIPFVGAGISVESGIPAISQLKSYLAKVRFYVRNHVYSGSYRQEPLPGLDRHRREYVQDPSRFVRDFGWPDFNQINADLWLWLEKEDESLRGSTEEQPTEWEHSRRLRLHRLIQEQFVEVMGKEEPYVASKLVERIKRELSEKQGTEFRGMRPRLLHGNWQSLLDEMTSGNLDYVDSLFRTLARGRHPNASHTFLAFLMRRMNWKLVLTTNFDDLLEKALDAAGVDHTLFDVSRDAPLPHPAVVAEQVSLVKLHGSAYGLRVGERLDYPLELQAKSRLLEYLPKRATLLVIGFSGWERRMMQFVEAVACGSESNDWQVVWLHQEVEPEPLEQLGKQLEDDSKITMCRISDSGRFLLELYQRATSTHPRLGVGYRLPDLRPIRLLHDPRSANSDDSVQLDYPIHLFTSLPHKEDMGVEDRSDGLDAPQCAPSAEQMAHFISDKIPSGYTTIWIELEGHHTVELLVTTILDQLSHYDSGLSPLVSPTDTYEVKGRAKQVGEPITHFGKAVYRIHDALRRGSYVLAISSVEAFGSPFTLHHGYTQTDVSELRARLRELRQFLLELTTVSTGVGPATASNMKGPIPGEKRMLDSFICLAIDAPVPRHTNNNDKLSGADQRMAQQIVELRQEIGSSEQRNFVCEHRSDSALPVLHDSYETFLPHAACRGVSANERPHVKSDQPNQLDHLLLGLLSMFRRPRHIVAIRSLADVCEIFDSRNGVQQNIYKQLDESLKRLQAGGLIYRCEGGHYWMDYVVRNTVYDAMTNLAHHHSVQSAIETLGESGCEENSGRVLQLAFLSQWHAHIARYYYAQDFLASRNISAFTEYLYHRISAARYMSMLHFVFTIAARRANSDDWLADLLEGLTQREKYDWHAAKICPLNRLIGGNRTLVKAAEHVCQLRDADIASIHQTIVRERDGLLTAIPAETLCGWIDRICDEDLLRCSNPIHPARSRIIKQADRFLSVKFKLIDELLDIKAKVLRERMEYARSIEVRKTQIASYLNLKRRASNGFFEAIEASRFQANELEEVSNLDPVLESLRDIGTCYASQSEDSKSKAYYSAVEALIDASGESLFQNQIERHKVRLQYRKAFAVINPHDPWSQKGGSPFNLDDRVKLRRKFENAKESIGKELLLVEESSFAKPQDYYEFRCFLTTLQARGCYLNSEYQRASELLERAAAGLDVVRGQERLALAVTQIYDAESRLLEVDSLIQDHCLDCAKERYGSEFAKCSKRLLQWKWNDNIHESDVDVYLSRVDDPIGKFTHVTMRDVPVHYWSSSILDEIDRLYASRIDEVRIRAEQRISAADAAIRNSRELLKGGRRNVSWWHRLYVLDAQATIERLFFMATFPYELQFVGTDRRAFRGQLHRQIRCGLRAVRSGLNNLHVDKGKSSDHFIEVKEQRLLRLWLEIMIAGWFVSVMAVGEEIRHGEFPRNWLGALNSGILTTLFARWQWLNEAAGIRRLTKCTDKIQRAINQEAHLVECTTRFSLASRVALLRLASRIIQSPEHELIEVLYRERRKSD